MLVLNFLFFLPDSMIWSLFMLGIKIWAILNLELKGLHENVQNFYSRCLGSREIAKNEVETVLVDTLYYSLFQPIWEAFQTKKQVNLGNSPKRGWGIIEKSKKSQVSVGNSSILGGGSSEIKKVPSSRGYQRLKNNDSFSSYEDPKT